MWRSIPKDNEYFILWEKLAGCAFSAAKTFVSPKNPSVKASEIKDIEKDADEIKDVIIEHLDIHRDAPLREPEDIARLVHHLDSVVNCIEKASDRTNRYGLSYSDKILVLGQFVLEATQEIQHGIKLLRDPNKNYREIREAYLKIDKLESRGDHSHRESLSALMGSYPSTIEELWDRLKQKEVLGLLERALDRCEDVGNFIESLKKKNA